MIVSIVASIILTVLGAWLGVAWADARSRKREARAALEVLDSALSEAIQTIRTGAQDAFAYMRERRKHDDNLLRECRGHLPARRLESYDAAIAAFEQARDELVPAITEFTRRQVQGDYGIPRPKDAVIAAMQNLLQLVREQ